MFLSSCSLMCLALMEVYRLEIREALRQLRDRVIDPAEFQCRLDVSLDHAVLRIDPQESDRLRVALAVAQEAFMDELERQLAFRA